MALKVYGFNVVHYKHNVCNSMIIHPHLYKSEGELHIAIRNVLDDINRNGDFNKSKDFNILSKLDADNNTEYYFVNKLTYEIIE